MFPFEKLEVYHMAFRLNERLYHFLKQNTTIAPHLKNQLSRSSLSILLNISEGSAKLTPRDRRNFFVIARGSVFECSSICSFLCSVGEVPESLNIELQGKLEEISKVLYAIVSKLSKP